MGYSPWGHKELDTTEQLTLFHNIKLQKGKISTVKGTVEDLAISFEEFFCCIYHAAAAAKSLQSCPTLCDPIDSSPPGSAVPGILQARTLEWVAISFSTA